MYRSESEDDFKILQKRKWVILGINGIVFLVAFAMVCVCFWIRFDLDFREWVQEMDWYVYWYCMYVCMIAFILVAVTSILQAYAVIEMVPFALGTSIILLIICWFMELIGGILIIIYGVEQSPALTNSLDTVFFRLIYDYDINPRSSRILTIIQEYVYCCGSNGSEDYIGAYKAVPWACRHPVTGNEYTSGCKQVLAWWLEPWTGALSGACAFLIVVHVVQIILLTKFTKHLTRYDRTDNYEETDY